MKISIVIPVYRSENFIEKTVATIFEATKSEGWQVELVLVNDNSPDGVWSVIRRMAESDPRIKAIALVRNYGQHTANIVGFRYATGDCVITMDDDLQNPPGEIRKLVGAWKTGHDLVVGTFDSKKHGLMRRLGSGLMQTINKRIFKSQKGFRHTNFRLIDRSVVKRINTYRSRYPYTSGLAIMFANNPVNISVNHSERIEGTSNYRVGTLLRLAWNIIFNYSRLPIRVLLALGFTVSIVSGIYAVVLVFNALVFGTTVPGWTSLVVIISISNAIIFLILSLIGEYLTIVLDQLRSDEHYHIRDTVGINE